MDTDYHEDIRKVSDLLITGGKHQNINVRVTELENDRQATGTHGATNNERIIVTGHGV